MGDGRKYCYSARDIRHALRVIDPEREPRGLVAGFEAFVKRDGIARARLAGNHPKRHSLLDRVDDLPFTVHEDLMQLDERTAFTPSARDTLDHSWHLEAGPADRARMIRHAETALLLVRFLTLLGITASRTHSFVVLFLLSQLLDQPQTVPTWHVPATRPVRTVKPPGKLLLAEPRTPRAPTAVRPSSPSTARTAPDCARHGGAL